VRLAVENSPNDLANGLKPMSFLTRLKQKGVTREHLSMAKGK